LRLIRKDFLAARARLNGLDPGTWFNSHFLASRAELEEAEVAWQQPKAIDEVALVRPARCDIAHGDIALNMSGRT
jgi:hypothetical protein